jgi:hypothetical protein
VRGVEERGTASGEGGGVGVREPAGSGTEGESGAPGVGGSTAPWALWLCGLRSRDI